VQTPEDVHIVELPARRLAAVRHVGPFEQIGAAFTRLGAWTDAHPGATTGAPLAIYIDDPSTTPPESLRSDAAVPIADGIPVGGVPGMGVPGVGEAHLPGGRYAVMTHVGPYSGLGPAWGRFMVALAELGLELDSRRPCFEVYQDEPGEVDESELVTVLHQPVA
jgi:AraC family transcriptional regulator